MKRHFLLAAATLLLANTAFAADNPWFGTWKLNRAKSTLTGTTYTVVKTGNTYHFDFGALKFEISDDGKDYPIFPNHTSSLKPTGKNEWLGVNKVDGVETSRSVIKLSGDGKTETEATTGTRADGSTYKSDSTSERISGGPDLAGTWKDTKESSSAASIMVYSDAGPGKLKIDYPASKGSMLLTLDGKPVPETGPRAVPEFTTGFKRSSATELHYVGYLKGKPDYEGTETLSADGKVMTDVSWLVSKPGEKTTQVYEKQ